MRRVCLVLPTNRPCVETITAIAEEAAFAAERLGVEVVLLILDSSSADSFARHARAAAEAPLPSGVTVVHMNEASQRDFLLRVMENAHIVKPDLLLDLMLPTGVSYGACTNRAFLIASALDCESVHRRDSDSKYQVLHGAKVFPILHEVTSLGRPARDAVGDVTETRLDPVHAAKPVVLVGGSFVGDMSVDIGEIARLDRDVYYDVVGLWAPGDWSAAKKRELADDSFVGTGNKTFTQDHSLLTIVDPMRIDMCNIAFHRVHEQMPLSPATETIGSDYFLHHVVFNAQLPGVLHNRDIVNFHTDERKTGGGFEAYQLRLVKFFLSMLYLHFVYGRLAEAGGSLLDSQFNVRTPVIAEFLRASTGLAKDENVERLESLGRSHRKLGGRYADFADLMAVRGTRLLTEAEQDMVDFAILTESWEALVQRCKLVHPGRER